MRVYLRELWAKIQVQYLFLLCHTFVFRWDTNPPPKKNKQTNLMVHLSIALEGAGSINQAIFATSHKDLAIFLLPLMNVYRSPR